MARYTLEAVFKAVDRFTAPVNRMQNRIGRFTRGTEAALTRLSRRTDGLVRSMKGVGLAAVASFALIGTAAADVIRTGAEFEQTVVNAAARLPGQVTKGTEAYKELELAARKVGATTEFTASQSASALNFLIMAGFDAKAAMAALPGVVDLATASNTDLATATDIASDSLGAFGLLTKDTAQLQANLARVNDVLVISSNRANMTIGQMFEALKTGAPIARKAGADVETTATLIAKMADAGIKGQRAGTALKNIFLAIGAPTSQAAQVMRRLGVEVADADGNMRDALSVLEDFQNKFKDLSETGQLSVTDAIFGKIPIAAAINLIDSAGESMREFRQAIYEAGGESTRIADIMRDTVLGRMKTLFSAIESVKISFFTLSEGPLTKAVDRMTEYVRANEEFIALKMADALVYLIENFDKIVTTLKNVGIAAASLVAVNLGLKAVTLTMAILNGVLLANPIVLILTSIIVLVGLLSAAFIALGGEFSTIWDGMTAPLMSFVNKFDALISGVMMRAKAVKEFFSGEEFMRDVIGIDANGEFINNSAASEAQTVSPGERTAQSVSTSINVSRGEVVIRDETGRAEANGPAFNNNSGLSLQSSGGMNA